MYSGENKDKFPRMATGLDRCAPGYNPGPNKMLTAPSGVVVYPEYLSDILIYFCPSGTDSDQNPDNFINCSTNPNSGWCRNGQLWSNVFGRPELHLYLLDGRE